MAIGVLITAFALAGTDCHAPERAATDVNTPVATAEILYRLGPEQTAEAIRRFAKRRHFAVQEVVAAPQGVVEFSTTLFRGDIKLSITKLRGEPLEIFAYPLCACEAGRIYGLQEAADVAVTELREELQGS